MSDPSALASPRLSVHALNARFTVHCASDAQVAVLERQWSRLRGADASSSWPAFEIDLRSTPTERQGRDLLSRATIQAITAAAGTRFMVHAAGLADPAGNVVALVGPSGMGKTTAASYLARHGFGYVTDETVSVGTDGDVLPFPRPLSIRLDGTETQRSPDDLGLAEPPPTLRIARILLLERDADHEGPPRLTPVPLLDALMELIPHASALPRLSRPLQTMCRLVDTCGGVRRLTYSSLDPRIPPLLAALMQDGSDETQPWQVLPDLTTPTDDSTDDSTDTTDDRAVLRRGRVTDGVLAHEEALVMVDDVPVRLGAIGLTIWEAARDGVHRRDLVGIVEGVHGRHDDAARIVDEATQRMVQAGLLVDPANPLPDDPPASG